MENSPIVVGVPRLHQQGLYTLAVVRCIQQALGLGITSFDHADIYGGDTAEALFGQALGGAVAALQVQLLAEGWCRVWQASTGQELP